MSFKQVPKAFEEMLLNSRIDDLERQVSDLQNKVSHWESRAEHAECYLAKSEQFCDRLTADNARLRELLQMSMRHANQLLQCVQDCSDVCIETELQGLADRIKAAIGEGE